MRGQRQGRVVVVGASIAGLLAARALSDHVESVVTQWGGPKDGISGFAEH